jgi:subtilisin family serine protease
MGRAVALLFPVLLVSAALSGCLVESAWALDMTGISALHARGYKGAGVKLAVIDTGIDPNHPEFKGLKVVWRDLVHGRAQPYDDSQVGHGTHVAGIIIAQGDLVQGLTNGVRLQGAAPEVSLIVAKAVGGSGEGRDEDVAAAVNFAVQQGAHVIVMSLGGRPGLLLVGTATEGAVNNALNRGVVVVAAAGNRQDPNEANDDVASPASVPGVIAVGAVDKDKRVAPFSFRGSDGCTLGPIGCRQDPHKKPEIVAPGVGILSAARDQRYAIADGTSQATPFVGAAVALLLQANPEFKAGGARGGSRSSVDAIKLALAQTAEKVGPLRGQGALGHDDAYGYGLLRADLALARL